MSVDDRERTGPGEPPLSGKQQGTAPCSLVRPTRADAHRACGVDRWQQTSTARPAEADESGPLPLCKPPRLAGRAMPGDPRYRCMATEDAWRIRGEHRETQNRKGTIMQVRIPTLDARTTGLYVHEAVYCFGSYHLVIQTVYDPETSSFEAPAHTHYAVMRAGSAWVVYDLTGTTVRRLTPGRVQNGALYGDKSTQAAIALGEALVYARQD